MIRLISVARLMACLLLVQYFLLGCSPKKKSVLTDTPTSGVIHISVDESFKPVIDEQIKAFEGSYPAAKIMVEYKPEAECLRDLLRDSATRLVIVTRGLNDKETRFFEDSVDYVPHWDRIASDAIAVVINSSSTDTVFSVQRLQQQLSGKRGRNQSIVFDGLSATSTVRYALDSILNGKSFDTSVVKAVSNSNAVLDYVAANKDAIGLVGISWIGNPEDTAQVRRLQKVKLAYVQCAICADSAFVKPNQLSILTKRYPLRRGLYYILKENFNGLGSGFTDFMQFERGQLIFKRAYLGSSKMGFAIRSVKINEKLKQQ